MEYQLENLTTIIRQ